MKDNREPTIHMIGNAHLDPAWMWEWGEGVEAFIATCRSALERMEENPNVLFTCSSAAHYQWVEELEPELFEQIQARVAEGRWEVVGGWWTQADCNLPSGEGFVRQGLLGQRYFIEKFGKPATVGYSPDAFGHDAGLPQLLSGVGLTAYIFCRPDPTELTLPTPLFRWFSPDGSSVDAYRVPFHYNMYLTSVPKKVSDLLSAYRGSSDLTTNGLSLSEFSDEWALFYGVGNHGGGPTKEHIREIIAINSDETKPEVWFGRLDTFFANRRKKSYPEIPEWHDDLQMNSPGCYSVHSKIKQLNRKTEYRLLQAERLGAMEAVLNTPTKPYATTREELTKAWQNVCFNHFHDILCGVAIPEALDQAVHLYGESLSIADRITRYEVRRIVGSIDTRGEGQQLLLINTHSFELDQHVTFELWHDIDKELWKRPVDLCVTDYQGNEVPVQLVLTSGKIGKDRVAGTFRAQVPSMGWSCWVIHYGQKSRFADRNGLIEASRSVLENEHLRVEFSTESGGIVQLLHKASGEELLDGEGAIPVVIEDLTDTWGHGVTCFDTIIGRFDLADVQLVEAGPTHGTVRVRSNWGNSRIQQDFTLYADAHLLHVKVRVFWAEPRAMLKLIFPTTVEQPKTVVERAYTSIEKEPDGRERPGGAWKALVGEAGEKTIGLGIADTLTHSYSADNSTFALSVLRSPSYATHDPHIIDPDEDVRYIDMGEVEFRYTLRPFVNEDFRSLLSKDAATLNAPPLVSLESGHAGGSSPLESNYQGIYLSQPNVQVNVFKRAEEGHGWIIRLFETSGIQTEFRVELPLLNIAWEVEIGKHEVKTFRIDDGKVREVDLLEH